MRRRLDLFGLLAEFAQPEPLVAAARRAQEAGYRKMEAYSPFPVEELPEALHLPSSKVPVFALLGGVVGGIGAYFMLWYSSVIDWPWNVGGRPHNSWPSFIPITFELTVLGASLAAFISTLALSHLPKVHDPVFNVPVFRRCSRDRFFLCIQEADPKFDPVATREFLEDLDPLSVEEVPL